MPGFDGSGQLLFLKFLDLIYSMRVHKVLPKADILITNTFWLPILVRNRDFGLIYAHVGRYPKGQIKFYKHTARFHAPSRSIANSIIKQEPWSENKVKVIPYPSDIDANNKNLAEPESKRKDEILYVGRIHPEKGIGLLLEAFKLFRDSNKGGWNLTIIGPWESKLGGGGVSYYNNLKEKFKEIEDCVNWVGNVFDSNELASYYRRSALFIYPSLAQKGETFGKAILEAMSYGCPVLVSDLDCFKDFVEDKKTGFIFNHRSENPDSELFKKIIEITNNREYLLEISKSCLEKAKEYNMEHISKLYLSDFESLVKEMK